MSINMTNSSFSAVSDGLQRNLKSNFFKHSKKDVNQCTIMKKYFVFDHSSETLNV
jgi:hypothetical protein